MARRNLKRYQTVIKEGDIKLEGEQLLYESYSASTPNGKDKRLQELLKEKYGQGSVIGPRREVGTGFKPLVSEFRASIWRWCELFPEGTHAISMKTLMEGRNFSEYRDEVIPFIPFVLKEGEELEQRDPIHTRILWTIACFWYHKGNGPKPDGRRAPRNRKSTTDNWMDTLKCPVCNVMYTLTKHDRTTKSKEQIMLDYSTWLAKHSKTCQSEREFRQKVLRQAKKNREYRKEQEDKRNAIVQRDKVLARKAELERGIIERDIEILALRQKVQDTEHFETRFESHMRYAAEQSQLQAKIRANMAKKLAQKRKANPPVTLEDKVEKALRDMVEHNKRRSKKKKK